MKIKAKSKDGITRVRMLIKHPMDTGRVKDPASGELIPPRFIQELACHHGDKLVFSADLGTSISKNPYLAFRFAGGAAGDKLTVTWRDNTGATETADAAIR